MAQLGPVGGGKGVQGDQGPLGLPGLTGGQGLIGPTGAPGGLLAITSYAPTQTIYTITSGTYGDVDAINLKVTAVIPASGKVVVRLTAYCDMTGDQFNWGLRVGTTDLPNNGIASRDTGGNVISMAILVTGQTPGASVTFKWAAAIQVTAGRIIIGPGTAGTKGFSPGVMEVWAVP